MDIIPIEYIFYCSGVFTILVLTVVIKNLYNIKDTGVLTHMNTNINNRINNSMKKVDSMSLIMDRKKYDICSEEKGSIVATFFDKIPEDNKYVNLWLSALINKKGSHKCASPNCLNMLKNNREIFMAFDSKFCSYRCRSQAQNYLGEYWNVGK